MKTFLLVYDRRLGGLLRLTEFAEDDRQSALEARREAEMQFPGKEVVLLEAHALADLEKTHARYFGKRALDNLASTATQSEVFISQAVDVDLRIVDPKTD